MGEVQQVFKFANEVVFVAVVSVRIHMYCIYSTLIPRKPNHGVGAVLKEIILICLGWLELVLVVITL